MKGFDTIPTCSLNNREKDLRKEGGSGSGRLGAAVQRAMAMRERHSSSCADDVKGIGAIRDVYISWLASSPPKDSVMNVRCCKCGGGEQILHSAIGTQSMKYTRFFLDDQGFSVTGDEDYVAQVCGVCSSSVEDLSGSPAAKKKSFFIHVCRQLLGFSRKSFSAL
ncbi:hypothetical protein SUGI_1194460 [Cryptomeria japonica]|nr:hypothetical protein SUGI_1194460 [Cryptomeria japonica]